jgi:hypothetical protein
VPNREKKKATGIKKIDVIQRPFMWTEQVIIKYLDTTWMKKTDRDPWDDNVSLNRSRSNSGSRISRGSFADRQHYSAGK